ncbi:MAG: InlB B-repeat-containing protein [Chitinispirillaceae bacterium]|nr:InlB B-repeat-containing protein [Chitinispirillaceae bacterium]
MKKCNLLILTIFALLFAFSTIFSQTPDFTDTHTDGSLNGWTSQGTRTWSETNGYATPQNGAMATGFLTSNYAATADGAIEVDITADQWNGGNGGIILRWTSSTSYYFIAVKPGNQWDNYIKFCENTINADDGISVASPFSMNTSFTLRVEMAGSNFKFYIDGTLRGEINDASHPTGSFGYAHAASWNMYTRFSATRWWNAAPTEYPLTISVNGNGSVNPPGGLFTAGSTVSLTATPSDGWIFTGWSGDLVSTSNPASITMDSAKNVAATFEALPSYTLSTSTEGNGSVSPDSGTFISGTAVTLTATPSSGWAFSHWSGDVSGSTNPVTLTIDENKTIVAHFEEIPTYNLSVSVDGNGTASPDTGNFLSGTEVEITATPQSGWIFSNWSGDVTGAANPIIVTMSTNKTIVAHFVQITHSLTTDTNGSGTIAPAFGTFAENSPCTLTATPAAGWQFSNWSGDLTGTANPAILNMDADKYVVAHFTQIIHALTSSVEGNGSVSPASGTYPEGTTVEVTATAETGWHFSHWTGDITGSENPVTVTMNAPVAVVAHFVQRFHTLTATAGPNGTVSPESEILPEGSTVTVTATADEGYVFDHWSGDASGNQNPLSIVMDTDKNITASFVEYIPQMFTFSTTVAGKGSITPSSGTFKEDTIVTLSATAESGWLFDHWEGDLTGDTNPVNITFDSDKSIRAVFILNNQTVPNNRKIAISAEAFDDAGTPLGNAGPDTVDVIVRLFNSDTAGVLLYTERFEAASGNGIVVDKGYLVTRMGEGITSDDLTAIVLENDNLWVELTIASQVLPRIPMTASAYSMR